MDIIVKLEKRIEKIERCIDNITFIIQHLMENGE